jgi:hypothetical protein
MRIVFNGIELPVTLRNSDVEASRHTGRNLRHLEVELVVDGDEAERQVRLALDEASSVPASLVTDAGEADGTWTVGETSSSYRDGLPVFHHVLELQEREDLKARALQLANLTLEPYAYEEQFDGDALVVTARVTIDRGQQDTLLSQDHDERYFPVIRVGLSEEPRMMRLGRCLWSREQRVIRQEIVLVDRAYDDDSGHVRHGFDEPSLSHLEEMAVEDGRLLCMLCDLLSDAGAISSDGLNRLAPVLDQIRKRDSREFSRVEDLDEW